MTRRLRVERLENSLSPTGIVLRWLDEAHACGDVPAYVASLLAQDKPEMPLDRLCREASQVARTANRGKRPELVETAVRTALRETVFRFELVMRMNVTTHDILDREGLIDAALSAHLALTTGGGEGRPKDGEWLGRLRDLLAGRLEELMAAGQARSIVEKRYLDSHAALFPEVASAWSRQVEQTQTIADMAARLGELDGFQPAEPADPEALSLRTTELFADLVEPARADALEKLGEGRQALEIAIGWVRTKSRAAICRLGRDSL